LPDIDTNVCGNRLVEPAAREACDGFAKEPSGGPNPAACAPPGDRYQCQYIDDAEHDCPIGYGAGIDGLCRQGLGVLSPVITHTPATGSIVSVADFDGDGRVDILATNAVAPDAKAVFFGSGGLVRDALPMSLGSALHPPVAGRFGADAAADVILGNAAGLLLMRGGAGPSFQPKGFASLALPAAVIPIAVPRAALVPTDESGPFGGHYVSGVIASSETGLAILAGTGEFSLVGEIADASLSDVLGVVTTELDASQPFTPASDELVIALAGNPGRLLAITPNVDPAYRRVIEVDDFGPGRRLLRGPFKVDTRVGIAVGTELDHGRYVHVMALGEDEQFAVEELLIGRDDPQKNDPILIGSFDFLVAKVVFVILPEQLLAHFFTCNGLQGECFDFVVSNPSVYPWTTAAFDEKAGVAVAGSAVSTGLQVFRNNAGQPALASLSISTEAPVQRIDVGDLDADTVRDFLVTTRGAAPGCDDDTRLFVAWGKDVGMPESVTPMADMPGLERLVVAPIVTSSGIDGAADVVVTTRCGEEYRAGYFVGSPSRQFQSPFPITDVLPPYSADGAQNFGDLPFGAADVGAPDGGP
ncbi:MAG: hypothetical protein JNK04_20075, partial [Myxococcales bacterium]|nr:hypothetical protein [Myxococcales bacterium]